MGTGWERWDKPCALRLFLAHWTDVKVGGKLAIVVPHTTVISEIVNGTCRFVWPLKLSHPICWIIDMLIINIAVTQTYAYISLYFQPLTLECGEHQIHFHWFGVLTVSEMFCGGSLRGHGWCCSQSSFVSINNLVASMSTTALCACLRILFWNFLMPSLHYIEIWGFFLL